jgi:hypothetical protein
VIEQLVNSRAVSISHSPPPPSTPLAVLDRMLLVGPRLLFRGPPCTRLCIEISKLLSNISYRTRVSNFCDSRRKVRQSFLKYTTPRRIVLPEEMIICQVVQNSSFYETIRLISVFPEARHTYPKPDDSSPHTRVLTL